MTRENVFDQYEVQTHQDGTTRIVSLGKFQSEPAYTPYFWDQFLDGASDEDIDGHLFFIVTDEDKAEFPELADVYGIALHENNTGFVDSYRLKTSAEYADAVRNCEENESDESL